jgi:hypothetical protein
MCYHQIWLTDGTAQYIEAADGIVSAQGVHNEGLRCVAVLIGAYDMKNGRPIVGCVNQPFVHLNPATGT